MSGRSRTRCRHEWRRPCRGVQFPSNRSSRSSDTRDRPFDIRRNGAFTDALEDALHEISPTGLQPAVQLGKVVQREVGGVVENPIATDEPAILELDGTL